MRLNSRIKAAREAKNWTQENLASMSGVSLQSIKRYESSKDNNITLDSLNKIAEALEVEVEYFIARDLSISGVPKSDSPKFHQLDSTNTLQIPIYDEVYASAGGSLINEEYITDYLEVSKDSLRAYFGLTTFENLSIIRSKGDSMTPTIPPKLPPFSAKGHATRGADMCNAH